MTTATFLYILQNIAVNNLSLPLTHKCAMHALVAAFLNLISQLTDVPQLAAYVYTVCTHQIGSYLNSLPTG